MPCSYIDCPLLASRDIFLIFASLCCYGMRAVYAPPCDLKAPMIAHNKACEQLE